MIKFESVRTRIRTIADDWRKSRSRHDGTFVGDDRHIYDRLLSLDPETATAADVAAIIGSTCFTDMTCDECGETVESLVHVGNGYDGGSASICGDCLGKSMDAFKRDEAGTHPPTPPGPPSPPPGYPKRQVA